ncbi:MAG: type VI secretion system baseplate subunit TssE, partial [Oxalobacteraceae bacterium]
VINYGIPDISGSSISSMNLGSLERAIRQAIWDFEPRLIRGSVVVKAHSDRERVNTVLFDIEADMWAQPYPERLYLKTELDIDSASIRLTEVTGKRP